MILKDSVYCKFNYRGVSVSNLHLTFSSCKICRNNFGSW